MKRKLKSPKKHHKRISLLILFVKEVFQNQKAWGLFLVISAILLLLPGQNYYQTLSIKYVPPTSRIFPVSFTPSPYPKEVNSIPAPNISAQSAIVADLNSSVILWEKEPKQTLRPASITKIMTALVALDRYQLTDILEVKRIPDNEESKMGLILGDKLSVHDLLRGLLIPSGNDAAYALADNYPGGPESFINAMNSKAFDLHLENTHFANPTGQDDAGHYSSSRDILLLAKEALKNPTLAEIISTNWTTVTDITGKKRYPLQNVNQLLTSLWGTIGIKTGFTTEAGECLVSAIKRRNQTIVIVVLKSQSRFLETINLAEWAFAKFRPTPASMLEK